MVCAAGPPPAPSSPYSPRRLLSPLPPIAYQANPTLPHSPRRALPARSQRLQHNHHIRLQPPLHRHAHRRLRSHLLQPERGHEQRVRRNGDERPVPQPDGYQLVFHADGQPGRGGHHWERHCCDGGEHDTEQCGDDERRKRSGDDWWGVQRGC